MMTELSIKHATKTELFEKTENTFLKYPVFVRLVILLLLLSSYITVYLTGGSKFAYLHIVYIPIILSSFSLRTIEVACVSVMGGVLMGPLMPLDTDLGISQTPYSWLMRTGFFILTGQIMSYFVQKRNVFRSELIASHLEILKINESLEEKVKERTSEIEGKNSELESLVKQLKKTTSNRLELLHILCHDLKNPLGAIYSSSKLLEDVKDSDSEKLNLYIELIALSAENGLNIIELIREYEALELHKKELKLSSVNLKQCVEESAMIVSTEIESKNIRINKNIPTEIDVLVETTSFIYTVLNNLLTNAIKFSYSGSEINISAENIGEDVILRIKDSGIGIPGELLGKIFDIHEKTTRHGTNGEEGTGFGMPLVKRFIESYGGEIQIKSICESESDRDHGTEIEIRLRKG